jgi:hypothetical protein
MNNSIVDNMILERLKEDSAPITAAQFAQYRKQVDAVFNLLQQQIISLDVTCGLLMESAQIEPEGFKAEIARRVKAVAEGMAARQQAKKEGGPWQKTSGVIM